MALSAKSKQVAIKRIPVRVKQLILAIFATKYQQHLCYTVQKYGDPLDFKPNQKMFVYSMLYEHLFQNLWVI